METVFDEKVCLCALNKVFGFEPVKGQQLLDMAGSAQAIFSLDEESLDRYIGPYSKYRHQLTEELLEHSAEELDMLKKCGADFIGCTQEGYPHLLKQCSDAPLGLYIKSSTEVSELFNSHRTIAVVGTREISPYGKEWCQRLIGAFAQAEIKPLVVSGLAFGTDITAQVAALQDGLPTVSVMATGIDSVYPYRHTDIAQQIVRSPGGALITDYPPCTVPKAINFLRRNRIIAGMCDATILVESKIRGGGMMTARLANDYSRDVFALPGRIDDICSQGCNLLIREKIAEPVTDLEDIVRTLGLGEMARVHQQDLLEEVKALYQDKMDPGNLQLLLAAVSEIRQHRGITLNELCCRLCMSYQDLTACTGRLEGDGIVSVDLLQRCSIINKIM